MNFARLIEDFESEFLMEEDRAEYIEDMKDKSSRDFDAWVDMLNRTPIRAKDRKNSFFIKKKKEDDL